MMTKRFSKYVVLLLTIFAVNFIDGQPRVWAQVKCSEAITAPSLITRYETQAIEKWKFSARDPSPMPEISLDLLSRASYAQLPKKATQFLEKYWLDLQRYPPLVIDSVANFHADHWFCGDCRVRFKTHINATPKFRDQTRVLVYVNNQLVGWIKQHGEPSFLALRNVMNSQGQLTLAMGGVYTLPREVMHRLTKQIYTNDGAPVESLSLNFDKMDFRPESFLLNDNAYENKEILQSFLPTSLWARLTQGQEARHQSIWREILDLLESSRKALESEQNVN